VAALERFGVATDDGALLIPSLHPTDPRFEPARYWRGPVWPVAQWVVQEGLSRYGFTEGSTRVCDGLLGLVDRSGFFEHYDPTSGLPGGGEQFAWTAAIVLDLLHEVQERGRPRGERPSTPEVSGA
jgi:glycogen debranching enzyme